MRYFFLMAAVAGVMTMCSCSEGGSRAKWAKENAALITEHKLEGRKGRIPETDVPVVLEAGKPYEQAALPAIAIADGVKARAAWAQGALLEALEMDAGAAYPEQALGEELVVVGRQGSAVCTVNGNSLELEADSVVYLTPGMRRSMKAGPNGFKALEVYSPVRADHLALAGTPVPSGKSVSFPAQNVEPLLEPARLYNLNEFQLTAVTAPAPDAPGRRSSANSRLVWGRNVMLSFVRMDPHSQFGMHFHPEDQLMMVLRGKLIEGVMTAEHPLDGDAHHVILQPGPMVHSAKLSEFGADCLDVFWPVRPDYVERAKAQEKLYREVIAPGTRPVKLAEGFTFAEGPTWLNGKLYFSDMYFRDHRKGDWTGSAARSRLIAMEPDGKWKVVSAGMQTNGTIASLKRNLLVCDMFGHRVIEMDPASGKVLRTVLDKLGGKPIDGPNDLVMDARGGLYITDPQFTPQPKKSQPGKQVYYIAPDGTAKIVIPAGEYAMPNGVELSPDGKTFYVNNTWFQPGENYLWAYDVQPDGSLTNKRKFAMLHLAGDVLSAKEPANRFDSRADGMAVDMDGRIYVATLTGAQVFDKTGQYVGTIGCPQYPVSLTFGGEKNDILYMVGEASAWSIQTKVKGFRHPDGLN